MEQVVIRERNGGEPKICMVNKVIRSGYATRGTCARVKEIEYTLNGVMRRDVAILQNGRLELFGSGWWMVDFVRWDDHSVMLSE